MKAGPRPRHGARSGYTLMEMLIASVLIASLMSAAWNLLSLYTDFLSAGREAAATQQLARSLFDIVSDDLQQVSLNDNERGLAPTHILPPPSPFDLLPDSQTGATVPGSLELIGTESSLLVTRLRSHTTAPRTELLLANTLDDLLMAELQDNSLTGSRISVPDIATVVYQFEGTRISDGTARSLPGGLHRVEMESQQWSAAMRSRVDLDAGEDSEFDRSTLESLLYTSSVDASLPGSASGSDGLPEDTDFTDEASVRSVQPQHEHIPEVVSCRFAYFDGSGWASNWDSRTSRTLPRAVRVEFSLLTTSDLQRVTASLQSGPIEGDRLDQTAQTIKPGVGAEEDEFDADPFSAANPLHFERIILLSPGDVQQERFDEAFPSATSELPLGGMVP